MEIIHQSDDKLVIRMKANDSLLNAIRRSVNEIPVLAIDEVEIFKNDSAIYDEFLAHRLGLVPLRTESSVSEKSEIELKLVKSGPGMVIASDLSGKAESVHGGIPITLLEEGQEVELVATARLGKGINHEKYSPGLCYYRHLVIISSKSPEISKMVEHSHAGMIKPEKHKDGWLCDASESMICEIEKIDLEAVKDSDEVLLFVESFGQISAREILAKSIKALSENLETFEKQLS